MRRICWSSWSSLTELAVGLTEEGCCAEAGGASETSPANAIVTNPSRNPARSVMLLPPCSFVPSRHRGVGRGVEAVHRAHRRARRIGAVHASHRHRALAGPAVVDGHDAAAVDAPRHLVLVLAGGDAGVALDAAIRVAQEFHSSHVAASYAARIWQSVTLGSCMPVAGS